MTAYTHKLMTEGEETKQTYLCFGIALTKLACSNRSHWDVSSGSLGAETGVCEEVWQGEAATHGGADDHRLGSQRLHQGQQELLSGDVAQRLLFTLTKTFRPIIESHGKHSSQ